MSDGETFCIYCQREYANQVTLRRHIERKHPDTYAFHNVNTNLTRARRQPIIEDRTSDREMET